MVHSLGSNRIESLHIFNNFQHLQSHQWHMWKSLKDTWLWINVNLFSLKCVSLIWIST